MFSASGSIFTIAGLLLSVKLSYIFHLKVPDKNKYYIITQSFGFAPEANETEVRETVVNVEKDEIIGVLMIIFGTLIWGYGGYIIK